MYTIAQTPNGYQLQYAANCKDILLTDSAGNILRQYSRMSVALKGLELLSSL